jgi:hypothetical protein
LMELRLATSWSVRGQPSSRYRLVEFFLFACHVRGGGRVILV